MACSHIVEIVVLLLALPLLAPRTNKSMLWEVVGGMEVFIRTACTYIARRRTAALAWPAVVAVDIAVMLFAVITLYGACITESFLTSIGRTTGER